ncbi:hypothetical protein BGW39_001912 [Mortierella sp. 14UC]|nr:hypothetical protein BGW39_001912 [Mortierella sp. 14UC]
MDDRVDSDNEHDSVRDGLEWAERLALVSLIEDRNARGGGVNRERTGQEVNRSLQFLSGFRQVLEQTGYGDTQEEPATRYVFSGMEGYPFLIPNVDTSTTIHNSNRTEARTMQKPTTDHSVMLADRTCTFDLELCLGPLFLERRGTLDNNYEYYLERMGEAEETDWDERVPFRARQATTASSTGAGENIDNSSGNAEESENTEDKASSGAVPNSNNAGNNNTTSKRKRVHSTKEIILQRILTAHASTPYTTHTCGVSAILPSSTTHPTAPLRIIKDLYRYNFVVGDSDSSFVTLIGLEKAQKDMGYLDNVKEHDRKLHIVCLNDGVVEENNGPEMRALLKNFLDDRYDDPAPWEKEFFIDQL